MKKISLLFVTAMLGVAFTGMAQELPQPSPAAKVEQRVGLTDITIEYSRPGVKGREIWGSLVPYDKMWRTGANKATAITFSDDVSIADKKIEAGSYALFTIPGKEEWEIILNSETESWGTGNYDPEKTVHQFKVKPTTGPMVERMRFTVENIAVNSADIVLAWEKLRVSFKVMVDVEAKAWANIMKAIEESDEDEKWKVYRNGANYLIENKKELAKAKQWIDKYIELKSDSWYSYWVQADAFAALGDNKNAIKSAKKAIKLGEEQAKEDGKEFAYKDRLETAIEGWKK